MLTPLFSECHLRVVDDSGARPIIELIRPLLFESKALGLITVPAVFSCDGCSIPGVAMSLGLGWPALRAGIVHDYLLTLPDVPRTVADDVFGECLEACGV